MTVVELTLERWVLEREALRNALAVARAALEFDRVESSERVIVENARAALSLTAEARSRELMVVTMLAALWVFGIPVVVIGLCWLFSRAPRSARDLDRVWRLPAREPDHERRLA